MKISKCKNEEGKLFRTATRQTCFHSFYTVSVSVYPKKDFWRKKEPLAATNGRDIERFETLGQE